MADHRKQVGTFISFNENVQADKKDGGTYAAWRLIYTNANGEAVNITKPVQSLKFNQPLAKALKNLQMGEEFTIQEEKNAAGFWEIKTLTKGNDTSEPMQMAAPAGYSKPAANAQPANSTGRDFESKDERNKKQEYIIRQSSLERAVETLSIGAKAPLNPGAVIELAEIYKNYVMQGLVKAVGRLEDLEDDIPQ